MCNLSLSVCVCQSVCRSVGVSVCRSVCLSVGLSVRPSVYCTWTTSSDSKSNGFTFARYIKLKYIAWSGLARLFFSFLRAPHRIPSMRSSSSLLSASITFSTSSLGGTIIKEININFIFVRNYCKLISLMKRLRLFKVDFPTLKSHFSFTIISRKSISGGKEFSKI